MDPGSPSPAHAANTELWLLVPGPRSELAARLQAFASTAFARIWFAPSASEREWAEAFALAHGLTPEPAVELTAGAPDEPFAACAARAWPAFERARAQGGPCALVLVPRPVLLALFARALDLPLLHPPRLRIDPGRAVLLRDDPVGLVLRRANAAAPLRTSGTPLPTPERRP